MIKSVAAHRTEAHDQTEWNVANTRREMHFTVRPRLNQRMAAPCVGLLFKPPILGVTVRISLFPCDYCRDPKQKGYLLKARPHSGRGESGEVPKKSCSQKRVRQVSTPIFLHILSFRAHSRLARLAYSILGNTTYTPPYHPPPPPASAATPAPPRHPRRRRPPPRARPPLHRRGRVRAARRGLPRRGPPLLAQARHV